jgi:hypothetical protein
MTAVAAEVAVLLAVPGQQDVPLVASLAYCAEDPYAVRASFHVGLDEPVEWAFARDILAGGAAGQRQGIGDVQVRPSGRPGMFCLELASPFGQAVFAVPSAEAGEFLRRTYQLVPEGSESVDVDAELDGLGLRSGGRGAW